LKRLKQADEKFCEALRREHPQTGVSQEAGTERPRPVLRP
jgi:hypothetical protein